MSCGVPAQRHAGVFGRLAAGEDLVVTHDGHLILWIKDLQSADLRGVGTCAPLRSVHVTITRLCGYVRFVGASADQVHQPAQAVLLVEQLQHHPEGKGNGEEHGGVADTRGMGGLQQPKSVGHRVGQHAVWKGAHLQKYNVLLQRLHSQPPPP